MWECKVKVTWFLWNTRSTSECLGTSLSKAGSDLNPELFHHISQFVRDIQIVSPLLSSPTWQWAAPWTVHASSCSAAGSKQRRRSCWEWLTWPKEKAHESWSLCWCGDEVYTLNKKDSPPFFTPECKLKHKPDRVWAVREFFV